MDYKLDRNIDRGLVEINYIPDTNNFASFRVYDATKGTILLESKLEIPENMELCNIMNGDFVILGELTSFEGLVWSAVYTLHCAIKEHITKDSNIPISSLNSMNFMIWPSLIHKIITGSHNISTPSSETLANIDASMQKLSKTQCMIQSITESGITYSATFNLLNFIHMKYSYNGHTNIGYQIQNAENFELLQQNKKANSLITFVPSALLYTDPSFKIPNTKHMLLTKQYVATVLKSYSDKNPDVIDGYVSILYDKLYTFVGLISDDIHNSTLLKYRKTVLKYLDVLKQQGYIVEYKEITINRKKHSINIHFTPNSLCFEDDTTQPTFVTFV